MDIFLEVAIVVGSVLAGPSSIIGLAVFEQRRQARKG
jgi:hypothetical protein